MKSSRLHIVFAFTMLCNLIFTQVVIDFFHDHHAVTSASDSKQGKESLHEGFDNCKVCDLNISHELFVEDIFELIIILNFDNPISVFKTPSIINLFTFYIGRSPPIFNSPLS